MVGLMPSQLHTLLLLAISLLCAGLVGAVSCQTRVLGVEVDILVSLEG